MTMDAHEPSALCPPWTTTLALEGPATLGAVPDVQGAPADATALR
ncbi:hypothetical protein [Actinotalea ferrariae]|nr:hypothetical protein [Actinotalea ferrariae]